MSDVTNWSRRCKAYTLKRSLRANLVKRCHACDLLRDTAVCEDCRPNGGACVITAPDIYSKPPSPPHLTLLNLAIALISTALSANVESWSLNASINSLCA